MAKGTVMLIGKKGSGAKFPPDGNVGDVLTKAADGVEWKEPQKGVVIVVEENQTVNGYQVPKMTADDVTRAYNAVVAAVPCTLTDAQENQHFAVNQADTVSSDICVNVLYYDKMLLTYVLSGETVTTEFVSIAKAVDYSTTEQDTGLKWIDGKSIYQRTFEINTTTSTQYSGYTISTTPIDTMVNVEGFVYFDDNDGNHFFYPVFYSNNTDTHVNVVKNGADNTPRLVHKEWFRGYPYKGYITICYTKTT